MKFAVQRTKQNTDKETSVHEFRKCTAVADRWWPEKSFECFIILG